MIRYAIRMQSARIAALAVVLEMLLVSASCADSHAVSSVPPQGEVEMPQARSSGEIYLYGEQHAQEKIMEKEADLWYDHEHEGKLRHLFVELPYYTAEYLNLWMKAADDAILDAVYDDWQGTAAYNPHIKAFYQRIKRECPETVFHGIDIGHQYATTGARFGGLRAVQDRAEAVEQGRYYYEHTDGAYREGRMAENFLRAFEGLGDESVMGIYGGAHIGVDAMDEATHTVPSMAAQLRAAYGNALHTEDLRWIAKDIEPVRIDVLTSAGKEYQASYYGKEKLTGLRDFEYRAFWRLENAYDDFKDRPKTGDVLPYENYPMTIGTGQVFGLEYTKTDGSVMKLYYRSDGNEWEGRLSTEAFALE